MKTLLLLLLILPLVSACDWDNPVSPPLPEAALKSDTLMVAILCPRPGTPAADSLGVSCTIVVEGGN